MVASGSTNPWRILVVDDDEMLNHLFCAFLKSKGLDAICVTSMTQARTTLQRDASIDLILLDYQLGDGYGTELLTPEARGTYLSNPPIIMISANEEPEFLEQCFQVGVNDYIIKPVNLSLLALKVEALIKSVGMQRLISAQNDELERFKYEAEREEQIAKFTYEYLLQQNSHNYQGVNVWLKSFAAFSGDIVLVKKSPSGNLYFVVADATGHGLSAAITIMPVVTIFNSMVSKGFHLQQMVAELNSKLVTDTPIDRFVAAILVEINPIRRELTIWNGGMPPVFWVNNGKILHEFHSTHMALGIMDESYFDANVTTIDLPDEGFLFACSDGLSEQEDSQGRPFSTAQVKNIIERNPQDLIAELTTELNRHTGNDDYHDDVTLCVVEPTKVFKDRTETYATGVSEAYRQANRFEWQVQLSGRQLEQCELPPLCNHFLQQIGIDQQRCQKIFTVVAEMVSNAVDHGVLGMDSQIKEQDNGFAVYFQQRDQKFKQLTDADFVRVFMQWQPDNHLGQLTIQVEDSGPGFMPGDVAEMSMAKFSGRGLHLIKHLATQVEIIPPGNKIRATIK